MEHNKRPSSAATLDSTFSLLSSHLTTIPHHFRGLFLFFSTPFCSEQLQLFDMS